MNTSAWTEVREIDSSKESEISYIKNSFISRVSIKEKTQELGWPVFIESEGRIYIYSYFETEREARDEMRRLIQVIK